jgi:hypothetical protein
MLAAFPNHNPTATKIAANALQGRGRGTCYDSAGGVDNSRFRRFAAVPPVWWPEQRSGTTLGPLLLLLARILSRKRTQTLRAGYAFRTPIEVIPLAEVFVGYSLTLMSGLSQIPRPY